MAPSLTSSTAVYDALVDAASLVSSAITVVNGDVLVVKVVTADSPVVIGTCSGGSQTWTSRASSAVASNCGAAIFTCTVSGSPGTVTVTVTFSAANAPHSMIVNRWASAALATTPATNATKTGSGAPSTTLTTAAASSVVDWCNGDWAAVSPATAAYRSSAVQDGLHDMSPSQYTAYYAHQACGAAGSQTFGLTAPTGQTWTMLGIEVQDGGGAAVGLPELTMAPRWSGVNYG